MTWEYKRVITNGLISERDLNLLGLDGWNHYQSIGNVHLFKRSDNGHVNMVEPVKNEMIKPNEIKGRK